MMAIMLDVPEHDADSRPLGERLAWFFGLALASLAVTAALAYGLRTLLFLG